MRDSPPPGAWSSALIATVVGFGGTIALVVQAARTLGASSEQTGSAVMALCLAIALGGAVLSIQTRMPVVLAWSTPGAALLAASSGASWPVAIGVFICAAAMGLALAAVPVLGRWAGKIPASIAAAMLAGVLLPFCLNLFRLGAVDPLLVAALVAIYVAARQRMAVYALLLVLAAGLALTLARGDVEPLPAGRVIGALIPVAPSFQAAAAIGLALPLFLVTLVSQNLPGLAVLRSAGYSPPARRLLAGAGLVSLAAAPFGGHAVNLAAITAAICTSDDAHPDRHRRWTVGVVYAGFYLVLAIFSPFLVRLFLALPAGAVAALTGIALIPALAGSLKSMLDAPSDLDAALVTFLATASGLSVLGLGSAFWGLVAGFAALAISRLLRARRPRFTAS
ncbi:benzoate/H(+) symporter BenE family transporter [Caulobacter sp. NIBR2454]|uniref:benzoate/H(+) symporter BenE family transporter n=1 Tax=Caulobacter sp. NIBR2454 TaxID=3015996 RepID=UPI0022B72875|nr:benzoate/H(+) symporter BenE family transporter [Caulobacter sp. NIBR2454]